MGISLMALAACAPAEQTKLMYGDQPMEDVIAQMTLDQKANMVLGTARGIMFPPDAAPGMPKRVTANIDDLIKEATERAAKGDTMTISTFMGTGRVPGDAAEGYAIEELGIPSIAYADGPAGLRLARYFTTDRDGTLIPELSENGLPDLEEIVGEMAKPKRPEGAVTYYQYCTAIPIATLLAQTFDRAAIEEAGDIVGGEMEEMGVDLWLAPGMNIQRNPLCGRNFEYYSEDPFLAGECAAADTRGVQRHPGKGTTIKHFACNNQEDNRMHNNAHVTERALREIYLRGFEYCVEEAQPHSVMTSYNLINGVHSANNYDLLTSALRDEWGFAGMVMTDWGTRLGHNREHRDESGRGLQVWVLHGSWLH